MCKKYSDWQIYCMPDEDKLKCIAFKILYWHFTILKILKTLSFTILMDEVKE